MRLSHINITMPKGAEDIARSFYSGLLGLREIPKPESIRNRGGVWFEAGGLDVHVSIEEPRNAPDAYRHFGLECPDVDALRAKLQSAAIAIEIAPGQLSEIDSIVAALMPICPKDWRVVKDSRGEVAPFGRARVSGDALHLCNDPLRGK